MRLKGLSGIASSLALLAMTTLFFIVMGSAARAQTCVYQDGGYCVSTLTATTSGLVEEKIDANHIFTGIRQETGQEDNLVAGTDYLEFYKSIWDKMIKSKLATNEDREKVFKLARDAGGTKIGGVNLVVLQAGTLQQLVDKKILTKEEAQKTLNDAKISNK